MHKNITFNSKLSLLLSASVLLSAQAVYAQNSGNGLALEEVLVTARKRVESLQDVPVAVTALSAAALQDAGLTRLEDISDRVPGLDLTSGNGANGNVNPYIRGVEQRLANCVDVGEYGSLGRFANNNPTVGLPSLIDACAAISPEAGVDLGAHSMPGGEYKVDDQLYAGTLTWDIGSPGSFDDLQF